MLLNLFWIIALSVIRLYLSILHFNDSFFSFLSRIEKKCISLLELLHCKNISENSVENVLLVTVVIRGCGEIGLIGIDFY